MYCSSVFTEPIQWMNEIVDGNRKGSLLCPKCRAKVGHFDWAGIQVGSKFGPLYTEIILESYEKFHFFFFFFRNYVSEDLLKIFLRIFSVFVR